LLTKLYEVFICARANRNCSTVVTYVNKREVKCTLQIVWRLHAAVLFTTLIKNLRLCSSAKAGIILIYS